ncbi:Esterase/lipase superfamily enzyme [Palleronia marisminoris]|uniref:Secreted effector protein pipB2 n=1 Tax=Palleronia marisminoris TaxID=315423 RepID=A0A1Y5SBA3_9RHOB|nr:alpha/beta hydrolase [Palleronia marisminoris]SFG69551.1 Esterase/lipase superfamily enzyme [Palleronia marisminoris]SLN35666.1 Secreted effector protein pipB2 [Palleronia marisminoris]
MANDDHAMWLREGVKKWNYRRKKIEFSPDLSGLNFFAYLPPDFRDSPKTSRYFEGIDLSGANLSRANLSGLNFYKAKFGGADMAESNLSLSNFSEADFKDANLRGANAENSFFRNSLFENTVMIGLRLDGADVGGAIIISIQASESEIQGLRAQRADVFASRSDYLSREVISGRDRDTSTFREMKPQGSTVKKTRKNRYDVFFATNRGPLYNRGELTGFGGELAKEISHGVCEVIVPEGHRIGSLGSPLWKRLINRQDDRLRLDHLISLDADLFWRYVRDTARSMKDRTHLTIFIHGFNTDFEEAVLRSAQIGYDLGLGQGMGLFSWPSKGSPFKYTVDEASAEASKYHLAEFIGEAAEQSATGRLNVIAHSMGCRCLIGALEVLANGKTSTLKKINQVVMAAADVDTAIMPHQGKYAVKHCKRVTSYVSDMDDALKASGWLHGYPRVGITPPTFVLKGMDTVLVNDLELGGFAHGYLSSSRVVLTDIYSILKRNLAPEERHALVAMSEGTSKFWRIKN